MNSRQSIELAERYGARTYHSLPVVISEASGVWVTDPEGRKYMDMLSAYSALNQGHRHPRVIQALKDQADRVTLTSCSFHNDQLGPLYEKLHMLTGRNMIQMMNSGVEAVETAIKATRRWAYDIKGVPDDKAEIIVCEGNFHGRSTTVISFSSEPSYRRGFGPLTSGFVMIPYGDIDALERAINERTAALLVEPIQGEAGIRFPPEGFVKKAYDLCKKNNVLFIADEIQTGFGRTGKMFGCDWEDVVPDVYVLGKALGAGVYPVSAVVADEQVLGVFEPASHGSTYAANPLACAVAIAALDVIEEENLCERSEEMGKKFLVGLKKIVNQRITDIRGRGLFIGVELDCSARSSCERLAEFGVLAKETHDNVIRFAPPLVISDEELDWALDRIGQALSE